MSEQQKEKEKPQLQIVVESELDRLKRDVYRSDKEKFELFCLMLKRSAMYKRAVITHK